MANNDESHQPGEAQLLISSADFYSPKLPSCLCRKTSAERGRHLTSTRFIPKGQLLFCERPIVALQSLGNVHSGVLLCHYCHSFVGTPKQVLQVAAHPAKLASIAEATDESSEMNDDSSHRIHVCPFHCGQFYCSEECQRDDWCFGGHQQLCTGDIAEPDDEASVEDQPAMHPLLQYKHHSIQSNEIFLLIASWLARILHANVPCPPLDSDITPEDMTNAHPYLDFTMKPWEEVVALSSTEEDVALQDSCRSLCEQAQQYLKQAWWQNAPESSSYFPNTSPSVLASWLDSPRGMSQLIGSLEQNCMGIRKSHPIRTVLMEDSEFRRENHTLMIQALFSQQGCDEGDDCCGDEDSDDDDENQDDGEDTEDNQSDDQPPQERTTNTPDVTTDEDSEFLDWSPDDVAEYLAGLQVGTSHNPVVTLANQDGTAPVVDDEWDHILPTLDGTAHYSLTEKMNHSCDPNVILLYKNDRGWGKDYPLAAYCVALRDIEADEELTLCYIDAKKPYTERQEALANYGFNCSCTRCQMENSSTNENIIETPDAKDRQLNEADDLFGDDDDSDDGNVIDSNLEGEVETTKTGDEKLQDMAENLESIRNASAYASIPIQCLAPIANYVQKLANSILQAESTDLGTNALEYLRLIRLCLDGIIHHDFSMCRIAGMDLESQTYSKLQKDGFFSTPALRECYWLACSAAAIGYAHEGSFLVAMKYLDKSIVLGQNRDLFAKFFDYVEVHAAEMATTPCPHGFDCTIPDFRLPMFQDALSNYGLSQPISFPVEEANTMTRVDFGRLIQQPSSSSEPIVSRGFANNWLAVEKWRTLHLLSRQHGHRLVPIEIGSMTAGEMTEKLVPFRRFVESYLAPSTSKPRNEKVDGCCWSLQDTTGSRVVAYLAQHALLDQIPELYNDVPREPCDSAVKISKVNAWIGTGGTRTPLHFDSYDNLLVQIVGAKYVRLYSAKETPRLYVSRNSKGSYGLQGNMSDLNCEAEDWDEHPLAKDCPYVEVLLLPGDCLYIPSGYWHYVRSLSTSVSINYWF